MSKIRKTAEVKFMRTTMSQRKTAMTDTNERAGFIFINTAPHLFPG